MRPKKQTNLERELLNKPVLDADLTEKQCRTNKIAATPPSLKAVVR